VPPPQREREAPHTDQAWIKENVGNTLHDSFKILGLGLGASEAEVKASYRALSRIWHPDKHNSEVTGKTDKQAADFFKLLNNAHAFLREIL